MCEVNSTPLLSWYDVHRRTLPWRARPGVVADPYHVWLSEIMLQQTTVATVIPYFTRFLERWPTVADLAAADLDAVLHAWQGLGYYARARHLHRCAQVVHQELHGVWPNTAAALVKLPGVGPYTAAAIAAIAFGEPAPVVDGNVMRVISRVYGITTPLPQAQRQIYDYTQALTPRERPGDYAQAMMDLGATVCTPRRPACGQCPWQGECWAHANGAAEHLPVKVRLQKPTRYGVVWLMHYEDCIGLIQRPPRGLLGGLWMAPSTAWEHKDAEVPLLDADPLSLAPWSCDWQLLPGVVRHTFTHFHLELTIAWGLAPQRFADVTWVPVAALEEWAMPTLMRRVLGPRKKTL